MGLTHARVIHPTAQKKPTGDTHVNNKNNNSLNVTRGLGADGRGTPPSEVTLTTLLPPMRKLRLRREVAPRRPVIVSEL